MSGVVAQLKKTELKRLLGRYADCIRLANSEESVVDSLLSFADQIEALYGEQIPVACMKCSTRVHDYVPHCCTGIECGCMGLPIEPPLCSGCER